MFDLGQLSKEALELKDYMSKISKDRYFAVWLSELEYKLWSFVVNGPSVYESITKEIVDTLISLSNKCGGWIARLEGT